jgi:uroporphyrinogen-III synthase
MSSTTRPLICSFESRRAAEMAALIERFGGEPLTAPSMREIPIGDNPAALGFIRDAIAGRFPFVVLLTGVGTDALFDVARAHALYDALHSALQQTTLIIRGPKPAAVLHKAGLKFALKAPEPNTWRELLKAIRDSGVPIAGQPVAVQEYGVPNPAFYDGLRQLGAVITPVPVYRWALPEDTRPLEAALHRIAAGEVRAVLFTSANQVSSVLSVADGLGLTARLRAALQSGGTLIGSIGPTCSEALVDQQLPVGFEASPPKMAPLIRGVLQSLGVMGATELR